MSTTDDDLGLQDLWQTSPPVDVEQLVKSVQKAQHKMRRFFYFELISSALGLVVLGWIFTLRVFGDQWWLLAGVGALGIAGQIWTWSWRRGLWNAFAKTPDELFALKRKHLLLDIKIARSCYIGVIVGALVGGVISFFDTGERAFELAELTRALILTGALGLLAFFVVWGIRKEIRAQRELKLLDQQIKEYENVESL